jgi:hypothetical protein
MPSGYIPGRTDLGVTVEDVRRPRTRRTPDDDHGSNEHPLVREFKCDMAALRAKWDREDEQRDELARRTFAARVAAR